MPSTMSFSDLEYSQCYSFADFAGSFSYKGRNQANTADAEWWKFGKVVEINLSDYFAGGTLDTESAFIPAVTFPNGAKLGFKVRPHQTGTRYTYNFDVRILDKNNNDVTSGAPQWNSSNGGFYTTSWAGKCCETTVLSYLNFGSRAWLIVDTRYYPQTPAEAVGSGPNSFYVGLLTAPVMNANIYDGGGVHSNFIDDALCNDYDDFKHLPNMAEQNITMVRLLEVLSDTGLQNVDNWLHSFGDPFDGDFVKPRTPGSDPAGTDDPSGPGGGGGNYDPSSDPIDFPTLPTGGPIECGAVHAHRVSVQTLEAIMSKLWDNSIFNILNTWQKAIENPMDAIVSLHCLPVSPEVAADPSNLFIGNFDTGLSGIPKVTSNYVAVDCGTLNIMEFWGSALDYSPYTKFEIFLPFIGVRQLAIEDVMASSIHVKYHIDVLTGDCIAFVKCGPSVLYHFNGNMRMTVPLTSISANYLSNTVAATAKMAGGLAAGAAIGGPGGAMATGALALSSANSIASSKVNTSRQGNLGGGISLMDDFRPYVIIHRPYQSLAQGYNTFKGYPSNITSTLSSLVGYTEVEHVHLTGIAGATDTELEEIENLLKKGVII